MWDLLLAAGPSLIGGLFESGSAEQAGAATAAAGEAQAEAIKEAALTAAQSNERMTEAGIEATLVGAMQARADLAGQVMAGRAGLGYMMGADPSALGAPPNLLEAYRQDLQTRRNPLDQIQTTTARQYAQGAPAGFAPPTGAATMALQSWYNQQTGETFDAPSGGFTPPPGSGWVQGAPRMPANQLAGLQPPGMFAMDEATAGIDREIAATQRELETLREGEQGEWFEGTPAVYEDVDVGDFPMDYGPTSPTERVVTEEVEGYYGDREFDYGAIQQAENRLATLQARRGQATEIATAYADPLSQVAGPGQVARPQGTALQEAMAAYSPPEQIGLRGEFFDPNVFTAADEFRQRNVLDYGDLTDRVVYDPAEFRGERLYVPEEEFTQARAFDPGAEFTDEFVYDAEDLELDPGYAFRVAEGQKALDRWGAASGLSASGRGGQAVAKWAQDLASQEYAQAYARAIAERNARLGIKQAQFAAGTQDIGRRQALGRDVYGTAMQDLARRQQLQASEFDAYVNESQRLAGLTGAEYQSADADLRRRYGIGLTEYNAAIQDQATRYNRAAGLAGVGATATGQIASQAAQTGAGIQGAYGAAGNVLSNIASSQGTSLANIYGQVGAGQAKAALGQGQALSDAFTGGASNWLAQQERQKQYDLAEAQNKSLLKILDRDQRYNPTTGGF